MANSLKGSPLTIDTFGSDVTLAQDDTRVVAMYITAYSSNKTLTFADIDGNAVLILEIQSGGTAQLTPSKPINFSNGLVYDDGNSDLAAGDFISVFMD